MRAALKHAGDSGQLLQGEKKDACEGFHLCGRHNAEVFVAY